MATARVEGSTIHIETDVLRAEVWTDGYVSGVSGGTLLDKKTGARDLGHGLDIVDFLLEPKWDEDGPEAPPSAQGYRRAPAVHGDIPKRFVELPQICTKARHLDYELIEGDDFVAVRQWFHYRQATYGRTPGSRWEQVIVFRDGQRYFYSADKIISRNTVDDLILRIDMPGHLKHKGGDSFEAIYLSYHGLIPSREFLTDFPGYVCFIQEIGGSRVEAGQAFGAAYVVGWFDDIGEMLAVYDKLRGPVGIELDGKQWQFSDTVRAS